MSTGYHSKYREPGWLYREPGYRYTKNVFVDIGDVSHASSTAASTTRGTSGSAPAESFTSDIVGSGRKDARGAGAFSHGHITVAVGVKFELPNQPRVAAMAHVTTTQASGTKGTGGTGTITVLHQMLGAGLASHNNPRVGIGVLLQQVEMPTSATTTRSGSGSISQGHVTLAVGTSDILDRRIGAAAMVVQSTTSATVRGHHTGQGNISHGHVMLATADEDERLVVAVMLHASSTTGDGTTDRSGSGSITSNVVMAAIGLRDLIDQKVGVALLAQAIQMVADHTTQRSGVGSAEHSHLTVAVGVDVSELRFGFALPIIVNHQTVASGSKSVDGVLDGGVASSLTPSGLKGGEVTPSITQPVNLTATGIGVSETGEASLNQAHTTSASASKGARGSGSITHSTSVTSSQAIGGYHTASMTVVVTMTSDHTTVRTPTLDTDPATLVAYLLCITNEILFGTPCLQPPPDAQATIVQAHQMVAHMLSVQDGAFTAVHPTSTTASGTAARSGTISATHATSTAATGRKGAADAGPALTLVHSVDATGFAGFRSGGSTTLGTSLVFQVLPGKQQSATITQGHVTTSLDSTPRQVSASTSLSTSTSASGSAWKVGRPTLTVIVQMVEDHVTGVNVLATLQQAHQMVEDHTTQRLLPLLVSATITQGHSTTAQGAKFFSVTGLISQPVQMTAVVTPNHLGDVSGTVSHSTQVIAFKNTFGDADLVLRHILDSLGNETGRPYVKVWDGSQWVQCPVKCWNGTDWVDADWVRCWDGNQWVRT